MFPESVISNRIKSEVATAGSKTSAKRGVAVEDYEKFKHDLLRFIPSDITMVWDEKDGRFVWYPKHIEEVYRLITYITKIIE